MFPSEVPQRSHDLFRNTPTFLGTRHLELMWEIFCSSKRVYIFNVHIHSSLLSSPNFSHHVVCAKPPPLTPVPVRRMPLAKRSLAPSVHDVHHSVRPVLGAEPGRHPRLPEAASLVAAPLRANLGLDVNHAPLPVRRAVLRTFPGGTEAADLVTIRCTLTQAHGVKHVTGGTKRTAQSCYRAKHAARDCYRGGGSVVASREAGAKSAARNLGPDSRTHRPLPCPDARANGFARSPFVTSLSYRRRNHTGTHARNEMRISVSSGCFFDFLFQVAQYVHVIRTTLDNSRTYIWYFLSLLGAVSPTSFRFLLVCFFPLQIYRSPSCDDGQSIDYGDDLK